MADKSKLFRSSSLEQISSPDKLNEYIRVSRPSVWVILGAITAIIIAAVFWAVTAEIPPEGLRPIDLLFGV